MKASEAREIYKTVKEEMMQIEQEKREKRLKPFFNKLFCEIEKLAKNGKGTIHVELENADLEHVRKTLEDLGYYTFPRRNILFFGENTMLQ